MLRCWLESWSWVSAGALRPQARSTAEFLQCSSRAAQRAQCAVRAQVPAWQWTWPLPGQPQWSQPPANLEPPWQWPASAEERGDTGRVPLLERAGPGPSLESWRQHQHLHCLAAWLHSKPPRSLLWSWISPIKVDVKTLHWSKPKTGMFNLIKWTGNTRNLDVPVFFEKKTP